MEPRKLDDRVLKPNVLVETRLQNALVEKRDNNKIEIIKFESKYETETNPNKGNWQTMKIEK